MIMRAIVVSPGQHQGVLGVPVQALPQVESQRTNSLGWIRGVDDYCAPHTSPLIKNVPHIRGILNKDPPSNKDTPPY